MTNKRDALISVSEIEELHTAGAGYDILRYIGLPELLGKESPTLLYFMGRMLARKFELQTIEDIVFIFDNLGWGKLELVKDKRKEMTFQLMSDSIAKRLNASFEAEFRLECGFLAEALQIIQQYDCECVETIHSRIHQVEITAVFTN
ncbi:YslB family protein [Virgibacillus salexigens]|uniref:YslB family protein n=1 Tax=Virgibacillus salexigens TaxID=61016 RepID=UPI00190B32A0|nr:YslB family protein [Virgibacillus salexigens]